MSSDMRLSWSVWEICAHRNAQHVGCGNQGCCAVNTSDRWSTVGERRIALGEIYIVWYTMTNATSMECALSNKA